MIANAIGTVFDRKYRTSISQIKKNCMSYIYLVTNKLNGKQYVGQHKYDKEGLDPKYFGSGVLLWRAYKKYGIENFKIELLEECVDEDLNPLEQLYIEDYNTLHPNGYNLTIGGDGVTGYTVSEEQKQKISKANKGRKRSEETRKKISDYQINNIVTSTPINQYNDNGDLVKTYPSIREAARQLECNITPIWCALNGRNEKSKGFRFRYADEFGDKIEPYTGKKYYRQRQINQYTLDGDYIKTWDSMADIKRVNGFNAGAICCCCKGKLNTAYGFIWKYADDETKKAA